MMRMMMTMTTMTTTMTTTMMTTMMNNKGDEILFVVFKFDFKYRSALNFITLRFNNSSNSKNKVWNKFLH